MANSSSLFPVGKVDRSTAANASFMPDAFRRLAMRLIVIMAVVYFPAATPALPRSSTITL
jgi:hypothetical protein